jgi:hypothetical protein
MMLPSVGDLQPRGASDRLILADANIIMHSRVRLDSVLVTGPEHVANRNGWAMARLPLQCHIGALR